MFGLTNSEGNHGEDAKEYWFYLDSTPTHSYLKCLYKYPQRAYPVRRPRRDEPRARQAGLRVRAARHRHLRRRPLLRRGRRVREGRARRHPDARHRVTTAARRPRRCTCSRRCGSATRGRGAATARSRRWTPTARRCAPRIPSSVAGDCTSRMRPACCSARTRPTTSGCSACRTHRRIRRTRSTTTSSAARRSTPRRARSAAAHHVLEIAPGASATIRVRLCADAHATADPLGPEFDRTLDVRREEADAFYATVIPPALDADRGPGDAPGARRDAVVQAVLRVRRPPLAARARRQPVGAGRRPGAQRGLVPHGRRRRHLDAGQVGVPMVRGLGPGLPLRPAVARRRGLRQGAGRAAAAHALHAPERRDPGLRMELLRRQPAGHRVGGAVRLRARGRDPRRRRPRVPAARLPAPADQLQLVGEPQGPRRPQPLPGRLPRARQHRDLRPLGAAARRRDARAGRRHRLDGPLLPVDAADGGRARARGRRLRRHGAEVRVALRVDRDRAQPARRRHAAVGRAGRLLLRRDADARRRDVPAEGALARRPAAAVRGHGVRPRRRSIATPS